MAVLTESLTPRIRQLPTLVVAKIAAGEVIERPASVAKELLENSVDAGSTRIDLDIEQGGAELIRVVDNGHGIEADDLPLAFANHATSKLASADDLFRVRTMGFRGEALSSIGGVAQVTLQSRPPDQLEGGQIICHGGEISPVRAWNGAPGTRLEVRHLFYNTPVRRKFLRTPGTEMGHLCEVFTRLALAQPNLHLTLKHNGKHVYAVPAATELRERLGLFFGGEVQDKLFPIDAVQGPARLHGFIAHPACERGNAKMQYLFLNGRWIRDRSLGHALQEAYRGLLMTGRYAVAFLFMELPPDHVDVNVHPTKAEVRFRDASALYSFVLGSVRNRLHAENLTSRLHIPTGAAQVYPPPSQPGNASAPPWFAPALRDESPSLFARPGFPAFTRVSPAPAAPSARLVPEAKPVTSPINLPPPFPAAESESFPPADAIPDTMGALAAPPVPILEPAPEKALQLYNAYLVIEAAEGMLVIDQHALHERVLYEHLKERIRAGTLEVQKLLIPEPVELSAEQAARVLEHQGALAELGLGVEDFGGDTILLTSYPALLARRPPAEVFRGVVDHLTTKDRLPTREHLLNDLLSLMACHAAVRAGDPLTPEEITALLGMRHLAHDTHHCPHGRPTALLLTRDELDRQFRRT